MTWTYWKWILEAAMFALLWAGFFFSWMRFRHLGAEGRSEQIRNTLLLPYLQRQKREEEQWALFGEEESQSLFYRVDRLVDYSNLRAYLPFMGAEFVIGVMAFLVLAGGFAGWFFSIGWYFGLLAGVGLAAVFFMTLRIMADVRYEEIENGLFAFVNVISTESKSSDDLITILDASKQLLCKPLYQAVENCCTEARATGRIAESLRHLELSVENEEFRKIVRNLAMCYRTDADYSSVIRECRMGLKEHISAREEQKVILGNSRLEVLELVGLGALTLVLIGNIIGEGNVFHYLNQTIPGKVVLIYILLVMGWCIVDALLTRRPR